MKSISYASALGGEVPRHLYYNGRTVHQYKKIKTRLTFTCSNLVFFILIQHWRIFKKFVIEGIKVPG